MMMPDGVTTGTTEAARAAGVGVPRRGEAGRDSGFGEL